LNIYRINKEAGTTTPSRWFLYLVIIIQQVLAAMAFPVARLGLNDIDPFVYAFFRFAISSIIYIPILLYLRRNGKIQFSDNLKIFLIGIILILLNQVVFLVGQSKTTAGHSSLLFATIPIFVYILAIIFLNEKATIRRTLGILIAAGGVYIILSNGAVGFGGEFLLGDLLVLGAVIAWAVCTVMAKPLIEKYGAFRVVGLALVYGSFVYLPYGLYRTMSVELSAISGRAWFSIFYLAGGVSVLAYFLWYWVLKYMEASRLAVVQNIQPVMAIAVASVMLAETISRHFVIGGIIVLFGVILNELK
jgi:drug/metabolite transporter (DMT)-like permease